MMHASVLCVGDTTPQRRTRGRALYLAMVVKSDTMSIAIKLALFGDVT